MNRIPVPREMEDRPVTVLLADGHRLFRRGLKELLATDARVVLQPQFALLRSADSVSGDFRKVFRAFDNSFRPSKGIQWAVQQVIS